MSVSVSDSTKVNCLKMPILIVFCFFLVVVFCTILRMSIFYVYNLNVCIAVAILTV